MAEVQKLGEPDISSISTNVVPIMSLLSFSAYTKVLNMIGIISNSVAQTIIDRQEALTLSDEEIGTALGHKNGNVVKQIKEGATHLPVGSVEALAKVLEVEARGLLRVMLLKQSPDLLALIDRLMPAFTLLPSDQRLLEHIRGLAGGQAARPLVFDGKGVIALVVQ